MTRDSKAAGPRRRTARAGSLAVEIAISVGLLSLLVVSAVTLVGYRVAYDRARGEAVAQVAARLEALSRTEAELFRLAEANAQTFRDAFLASYADPATLPAVDFGRYFFRDGDGAYRLRPEYFTGTTEAGGAAPRASSAATGPSSRRSCGAGWSSPTSWCRASARAG